VATPTLAAISLDPAGGGIAVVSRMLWHAFQQRWPDARLLLLADHLRPRPSFSEKVRFALRAAKTQAVGRTDWVLFAHLGLATVQSGLPRALRTRYGVFLHGTEIWRPLSPREQDVLANASLRVANSPFTAGRVMSLHPTIGPVEVCPLALPPNFPNAESSKNGHPAPQGLGPHVVLVVGRMLQSERYKGHDQLIEAWPRVIAAVPDAQLVIAGQGDDVPRLTEKAARSSVGRSITFVGFVSPEAREALYEQAALFALPSRGEGFGLVYLEAMSHRRACVGSVHDAARDVIVDNCTGRLVDQDHVEELASTLIDLLHDERRRREMGEAGYRRLHDQFTWDRFQARIGSLLNVDGAPSKS
jgi:phosphatidylinositol alpha-1,6-mannosyltransferase